MLKILSQNNAAFSDQFLQLMGRKHEHDKTVNSTVQDILERVKQEGDKALLHYNKIFDRLDCPIEDLRVTEDKIKESLALCSNDVIESLTLAAERIKTYHLKQKPESYSYEDNLGIKLGSRWTPIESAGLYVPGGTAAYPSSVLMNAIPAIVAGVSRLCMVVPSPDGKLNPLILAAAHIVGITEIWKIGGAQAIGALTFGTKTIKPVDKITGPGNAYVAAAKRQVFGLVGIDMIAGPSEILVVADRQCQPDWIAADLLSQAEHDPASQSILICDDKAFADQVCLSLETLLVTLPRQDIARSALTNFGAIIIIDDVNQSAPLINQIAPEHLELAIEAPEPLAEKIINAGAIFLGRYTPEAIGDYIGGSNHVLPTSRSARFSSGLGVIDFMKRTSLLQCDPASLKQLGPHAVRLAKHEGLEAHALSVRIRL